MSSDDDKDKQIAELQLKIAELEREKAELLRKIDTKRERQTFFDAGIDPDASLTRYFPKRYRPAEEQHLELDGGKSKRNKKSKRRNSKKRL